MRREITILRSASLAAASVALALLAGLGAAGAAKEPLEKFTATAVNMTGIGRATAGTLEIVVERWSTDAERDRLVQVLKEKGPEALLDRLRDLPRVGTIRTPTSLAWDLHFARSHKLDDGGRQVVLATDRPMGFREATNRPRSFDYPFTLLDIRFDADGKGVGKLAYASKVTFNEKTSTIEVENFGIEPVRLTDVRSVSGS
jgi:hypothetical protein